MRNEDVLVMRGFLSDLLQMKAFEDHRQLAIRTRPADRDNRC